MKRLLPLLLCLIILTSILLVSCGDTGGTTPPVDDPKVTTKAPTTPTEPSATTKAPDVTAKPCPAGEDHADEDDNGLCDECGISVIVVLDMFAINDLHGKLCDSSTQLGVDEMTTYLKNAYKSEDHVLILSSGDMWQGSSESNLTKGLIVTEWMNELDFVSMTLGNHEYDWGEEYIVNNAEIAEFPVLAINIYDVDTNKPVEYCQPSVLVKRGGATIGIIGAIGDCYSSISSDFTKGVYFKVGSELTELVKAEAKKLRDAGADFIIYSIHDGHSQSFYDSIEHVSANRISSYYSTALSDGYVDIVFEGHSHRSYVLEDNKGVYHLQNGGDNSGISYAEAEINFANGKSKVNVARQISPWDYATLEDDPIVENLLEKYEEQVSSATKVLNKNDEDRDGDELRQIVAELYMEKGKEIWPEYDIVLGGGYLSVRSPGYLPAGDVTFAQIQGLFPFENQLVLCSVKGQDLLNNFINSKNSNYFVGYSSYGRSVKDSIDPYGTYYIVVDSYSSTYAPNRLTEIERYSEPVFAQHLLAEYVENGGFTAGSGQIKLTSIADALAIGNSIPDNHTTNDYYYVRGVVTTVENTQWGNLYISDDKGNKIYIYGTYDETGAIRYDAMQNPPKLGDEITVFGQITHYVNANSGARKIEIKNARLIP